MKTKKQRILGTAIVSFAAISLAISACDPTVGKKTVYECKGSVGSGQRIKEIAWVCCDKMNTCKNGTMKRMKVTADLFSNSITGVNCYKNPTFVYDSVTPCCTKKPIDEEPTPMEL
ncbi:MAG: hypothetical protein QE269_02285 [Fimbriimonas sp.]|nr:hypothetical protein [Fimbriimonas sp.]